MFKQFFFITIEHTRNKSSDWRIGYWEFSARTMAKCVQNNRDNCNRHMHSKRTHTIYRKIWFTFGRHLRPSARTTIHRSIEIIPNVKCVERVIDQNTYRISWIWCYSLSPSSLSSSSSSLSKIKRLAYWHNANNPKRLSHGDVCVCASMLSKNEMKHLRELSDRHTHMHTQPNTQTRTHTNVHRTQIIGNSFVFE